MLKTESNLKINLFSSVSLPKKAQALRGSSPHVSLLSRYPGIPHTGYLDVSCPGCQELHEAEGLGHWYPWVSRDKPLSPVTVDMPVLSYSATVSALLTAAGHRQISWLQSKISAVSFLHSHVTESPMAGPQLTFKVPSASLNTPGEVKA